MNKYIAIRRFSFQIIVALTLLAVIMIGLRTSSVNAQSYPPFNPEPPILQQYYSYGDYIEAADFASMRYETTDALLGTRWRSPNNSQALCMNNTSMFQITSVDNTERAKICHLYARSMLYPALKWNSSQSRYEYDGDKVLTRYDLAASYVSWRNFYNTHNYPAWSTYYHRVGDDAPAGGDNLVDIRFQNTYNPNSDAKSAFVDYAEDAATAGLLDDYPVNLGAGLSQVIHPANRIMDPWGPSYPWDETDEHGYAYGQPHLKFSGFSPASNETAEAFHARSYCAATSYKNLVPSIFMTPRTECWEAGWEELLGSNMMRMVEDPYTGVWSEGSDSYWANYGFDDIGQNDYGWDESGVLH